MCRWRRFGFSALSWTVGEAIWIWYEVVQSRATPFPSPADAGFPIAVPLALAGVRVFFAAPVGVTPRMRAVVDALIVASRMLLVSWLTVLGPVDRGGTGGAFAQALGLAYPVGDLALLSAIVIVAGRTRSAERLPFAWIGAAFVALALTPLG